MVAIMTLLTTKTVQALPRASVAFQRTTFFNGKRMSRPATSCITRGDCYHSNSGAQPPQPDKIRSSSALLSSPTNKFLARYPAITTTTTTTTTTIPKTTITSTCGRTRLFSSFSDNDENDSANNFQVGNAVLVEVVSFGPLGATVHVVAPSHSPQDLPSQEEEWPVLGIGLISQRELSYFRDSRQGVDVVVGEVLPGFVERIRDVDGKFTIGLRAFGGRQKAQDTSALILDAMDATGTLALGDKSSPEAIAAVFPGVSKSTFKKAVSALFKNGTLQKPQAHKIQLATKTKK